MLEFVKAQIIVLFYFLSETGLRADQSLVSRAIMWSYDIRVARLFRLTARLGLFRLGGFHAQKGSIIGSGLSYVLILSVPVHISLLG